MNASEMRSILDSWNRTEGNVNSTAELLSWIRKLNTETRVSVKPCSINDSGFWFYDDYNGEILNRKRSFFSIKGVRLFVDDCFIREQPMIFQPEIGYLGIIVREIGGVLNFLMQAKIEPGNVNCVQISPTIQATKSNFTRAHGGKMPAYFDYFEKSDRYAILYDQIQSEQGSRFVKKRNRNIIIRIEEDIEILPNFRWMTLGQLKELMKQDNLVNMDTRTVISGLLQPLGINKDEDICSFRKFFPGNALYRSVFTANATDSIQPALWYINNYKMFRDVRKVTVPLNDLVDWRIDEYGVHCRKTAAFEVAYYDIEIYGREVQNWTQPLFRALGSGVFVLFVRETGQGLEFLVKARPEIGAFDKLELGPSVQIDGGTDIEAPDAVEDLWIRQAWSRDQVIADVVLSEEGGRFYHEQNRNLIVRLAGEGLAELPDGYFWMSYNALSWLIYCNNYVNIQLRNLLSLMPLL